MMTSATLVALRKSLTSTNLAVSQPNKHKKPARNLDHQPGIHSALVVNTDEVEAKSLTTLSDLLRGKVLINHNYCVLQRGFIEMARRTDICGQLSDFVNCIALNHAAGQPQKNNTSPIVKHIKYMKGGSCVDQLCSVQPVINGQTCSKSACRGQTEPV